MSKVLAIGFAMVLVVFGFLLFPSLTDSVHDAQTQSYTDTFTSVATAAGVTNASVTLAQTLYNAAIDEVTSITSDNTNDLPSADSFTASTDALKIKSLAANDSRNLTVIYNISDTDDYTGTSSFLNLTPLLVLLGVLAVMAVAVFVVFKIRG